jgi:hypothetical protein
MVGLIDSLPFGDRRTGLKAFAGTTVEERYVTLKTELSVILRFEIAASFASGELLAMEVGNVANHY